MNSCNFQLYSPGTLLIPNDYQLRNSAESRIFWGLILSNYNQAVTLDTYYDVLLNSEETGFYIRKLSHRTIQDLFDTNTP